MRRSLPLVAVALLAAGFVLLLGVLAIPGPGGWSASGPRFLPLVVAVAWIALAAGLVLRTTVWQDAELAARAAQEARETHWPATGLLAVALLTYANLLEPLGYVLATTLFLPAAARILGSRRPLRDIAVGAGIGVIVYVAFTEYLGVRLPAGLLPL